MSKYVAVEVDGLLTIHLPDISGNYISLCGMDGDDPDPSVGQQVVDVPKGRRVDCKTCWNIFSVCKQFSVRDFDPSGRG